MTTSRERARRLAGRGRGRPISPGVRADLDAALAEVMEVMNEPVTPEQHAVELHELDRLCDRLEAIVGHHH